MSSQHPQLGLKSSKIKNSTFVHLNHPTSFPTRARQKIFIRYLSDTSNMFETFKYKSSVHKG